MIVRTVFAALVAALALAAPASAHIQVRPSLVAPGDPVLFQVLVPGESDAHTVEVTLQVPKDVIPFSFEETPGWKRKLNEGSDGSIETIVWTGELASDGLATFSFLASTPEQEGEIQWKALQRYDDGETVRWIGAPDSDNPAAVTRVSASAPRENAGGESGEGDAAATPAATAPADATEASPAAVVSSGDSDDDPLPLILAIVALIAALAALALSVTRGRRQV